MTTQETPVLRAYTVFSWTAPGPARGDSASAGLAAQFGVGVYSNLTVFLGAPQYPGLVTGLMWADLTGEVTDAEGRWRITDALDSDAKADLLRTATSALRRHMGKPAEDTPDGSRQT
jgi:hypothetical protein